MEDKEKKASKTSFKKSPQDIEASWNFLSNSLDVALK